MATDDQLGDLFLRHALQADRSAEFIASEMEKAIDAALANVEARLHEFGPRFTRSRLVALRGELLAAREELEFTLSNLARSAGEGVTVSATGVIEQAAGVLRDASLTVSLARPSEEVVRQIFSRPFDGKSWTTWGRKLARDVVGRIEVEVAQAEALGESIPAIAKRLRNVNSLGRSSALKLARTLTSDVGNRARVVLAQEAFGTAVQGWRYRATLDGRTSLICAGLDGKTWRTGDEAIQRPPLHPNCRSVLVPLTDPDQVPQGERPAVEDTRTPKQREKDFRRDAKDRVGIGKWNRLSEAQRRVLIAQERAAWRSSRVGQVSADTDFESWFSRQSIEFQQDYLGPIRFKAFRRGLSIDQMATTSRPLNLVELDQRFPEVRL